MTGCTGGVPPVPATKCWVEDTKAPPVLNAQVRYDLSYKAALPAPPSPATQNPNQIRSSIFAQNNFYGVQMKVGGQPIQAVIDTGSSNLLVQGDANFCPTCTGLRYTPTTKATTNNKTHTLSYGSGHSEVVFYNDDVEFVCGPTVNYQFALSKTKFGTTNILGLAYDNLQVTDSKDVLPFFSQLVKNYRGHDVFSIALCGSKSGSEITFGGVNPQVDQSSLKYTPITEKSYYYVYTKSLSAKGGPSFGDFPMKTHMEPTTKKSTQIPAVILDSGTTLNLIPQDMMNKLVDYITPLGQKAGIPASFWAAQEKDLNYLINLPSNAMSYLPTLQLTFQDTAGKDFVLDIPPEVYLKDLGSGNRIFGFKSFPGVAFSILGQAFMEQYYVVFDRANSRIGFTDNSILCK